MSTSDLALEIFDTGLSCAEAMDVPYGCEQLDELL